MVRLVSVMKPLVPSAVAFACFLTTLLIFSPNVMVLQGFDTAEITGHFAEPYLTCACLTSAVVAVLSYSGRVRFDALMRRRALAWGAAALYAVANAAFCLDVFGAFPAASTLAFACALLAGVSVVPLCILWSRALSAFDLRQLIGLVAVAGLASSLVNLLLSHAPGPVTQTVFSLCTLAGAAWPAVRGLGDAAPSESAVAEEVPLRIAPAPSRIDIKAFLSIMGMPLLGMAISSFVTGISPAFVFDGTVNAQWLGVVIGAFLLVPLAALRSKLPVYAFAYTLYLPAVAAVVIVLCTFPATSSVRELAIVLAYGFYSMVCGVGVAASCAIANAREFPRSFVFATLVGTFCLTGIAGIVLGGRLDGLASNTGTLLVILTGLYGCWILVRGCSKAWRGVLSPQTDRIEVAQSEPCADGPCDPLRAESFDDRLARLSKEKSLSPRETEIVGYVGRGHSSVYVAKTLLISESTVYTHVRNVYRKLGISSREELIQLLNGQDASHTSLPARA